MNFRIAYAIAIVAWWKWLLIGLAEVATWRIAKFLDDCRSEFGHDTKLIGTEEQFGLRADDSPYLKHRQVNPGISLFRKYDHERTRSIRQILAQLKKAQNKKAQSKKAHRNTATLWQPDLIT